MGKKHLAVGIAIALLLVSFGLRGRAPGGGLATIVLRDEQGNPITASRVILDGSDLGPVAGGLS